MTVKADNERLELLARIEIARRMRAMDQQFVLMEFWETDVQRMLDDYAFAEKVPESAMYRVARDFIKRSKNGDELMRKYAPKRRTE